MTPGEYAERSAALTRREFMVGAAGLTFGIARLDAPALPGIDTPDDLRRAEAYWHETQGVTT